MFQALQAQRKAQKKALQAQKMLGAGSNVAHENLEKLRHIAHEALESPVRKQERPSRGMFIMKCLRVALTAAFPVAGFAVLSLP